MSEKPIIGGTFHEEDITSGRVRQMADPSKIGGGFQPTPGQPENEQDAEAYRSDPAYCKWYYSQQPRDPRLPPPIVRPGQKVEEQQPGVAPPAPYQPASALASKVGLVDMIQQDFPRTPSPVYAAKTEVPAGLQMVGTQAMGLLPKVDELYTMQQVTQAMAALNFGNPQSYQTTAGQPGLALPQQQLASNLLPPVAPNFTLPNMGATALPMYNAALPGAGLLPPSVLGRPLAPAGGATQTQPQLTMPMALPTQMPLGALNQGINLAQLNAMVSMGQLGSLNAMNQQIQQLQQLQQQLTGQLQSGGQLPLANPLASMGQLQAQMTLPSPITQVPPNPYYTPATYGNPPVQPLSQVNYGMVPPIYMEQDGQQQYYQGQPYDQSQQQYQMPPQQSQMLPNRDSGAMSGSGDKPAKKGPRRERGHDDAPRTRLMEEFRNVKTRRWELPDLLGHVVEFSRDQEGSRLIQRKLEGQQCTDAEKDLVFNEVYKEALGLMTDVFGNYVIQKLFEHGLPRHRKMLAGVLKGNVLALTLQTYGCRVIQKALEVIDDEDQSMVAAELDGHVLRCVLDQNGNHVIQKCIERIPPQHVTFIVQSFVGNVQNLAVHAYGCRVIQRILEYCEDHHEVISPILDEILDNVHILVRDQYGNYVVQHVLINGRPAYQAAIIERLRGDTFELGQHKFASNVVEKMFQYGTTKDRQMMLNDLLRLNPDGSSALHVMMKDQFANYVVQKIIDLADDNQRKMIFDHIRPHIASLRRYTYGKHIIARIEKLHTSIAKTPSQP